MRALLAAAPRFSGCDSRAGCEGCDSWASPDGRLSCWSSLSHCVTFRFQQVPEDPQVVQPNLPEGVELELRPLTPRRAAFVQEYLIDNNGAAAAVRAGFASASASQEAARLLADVNVAAHVARAQAQRASRVGVTQDSVLHEMSMLANSSIEHYEVDFAGNLRPAAGAPDGAMRAVQSVKKTMRIDKDDNMTVVVEFKLWDKPSTLKLMGRHIGLFPDRMEHTGKDGGPIETVTRVERTIVDPKPEGSAS